MVLMNINGDKNLKKDKSVPAAPHTIPQFTTTAQVCKKSSHTKKL